MTSARARCFEISPGLQLSDTVLEAERIQWCLCFYFYWKGQGTMQYDWLPTCHFLPLCWIYWRATPRRADVCVCVLLPCVWMRWSIFAVTCLAFFTSLAMSSPFIRSSCLSSITTLELLGTLERHTKDAIAFRLCINLCIMGHDK